MVTMVSPRGGGEPRACLHVVAVLIFDWLDCGCLVTAGVCLGRGTEMISSTSTTSSMGLLVGVVSRTKLSPLSLSS